MDTSGPYLSYGEDFSWEDDLGYGSCSAYEGGFALFTGPNTFAGTHSSTQGVWTLEGTIDSVRACERHAALDAVQRRERRPAGRVRGDVHRGAPGHDRPPDETSTTTSTMNDHDDHHGRIPRTDRTTSARHASLQVAGDAAIVRAGSDGTFTGSGFQPGESVTGNFYSDPIPMGTVSADAAGTGRVLVRDPLHGGGGPAHGPPRRRHVGHRRTRRHGEPTAVAVVARDRRHPRRNALAWPPCWSASAPC